MSDESINVSVLSTFFHATLLGKPPRTGYTFLYVNDKMTTTATHDSGKSIINATKGIAGMIYIVYRMS